MSVWPKVKFVTEYMIVASNYSNRLFRLVCSLCHVPTDKECDFFQWESKTNGSEDDAEKERGDKWNEVRADEVFRR